MEKKNTLRINRAIRVAKVRVIDADGGQLGILDLERALEISQERGFDLVEVSPTADPPVCRLMDYGKHKYEQSKKINKKKTQHAVHTKEVKFRPFIGDHDKEVKLRHIYDFLEKGNKVKITIVFRGRELQFRKQGEIMMEKLAEELAEFGTPERNAKMEGRNMVMLIAPKNK